MTTAQLNGCPPGDPAGSLLPAADRVLLVYPPVYDTRLSWAQWQQPSLLLRLATHFTNTGADVRLIDALFHRNGERLRRSRIDVLDLDGQPVCRWRFGMTKPSIDGRLRALAKEGWQPDVAYVECQIPAWWQGVSEVVELLRKRFPKTRVTVVGAYAGLAPNHALQHAGADELLPGLPAAVACLPADLSLYPNTPNYVLLALPEERDPADLVAEVVEKAAKRVHHLAIADHGLPSRSRQRFRRMLELLSQAGQRVNFYALGSLTATDIADDPDLAGLLRAAGFTQLCFADDRTGSMTDGYVEQLVSAYRAAAAACHRAGFLARTEDLCGGISVGRPGEHLEERARLMTQIADAVGSVIVWPYQPAPDECPSGVPLHMQNGKLFPFRHANRRTYQDYMSFLGLSAVLNAKYRDRTFDFLGDGLIPRLLQDSFERRGWEPPAEMKGPLQLPVLVGR